MNKYPYISFYPGDYLRDTMHLTTIEHGAYLLLIFAAWSSDDCSLPNNHDRLRRICKLDVDEWASVWGTVSEFFEVDGDRIIQKRLRIERQKIKVKQDAGRAGGLAKASNRLSKPKQTASKPLADLLANDLPNRSMSEPDPEPYSEPDPDSESESEEGGAAPLVRSAAKTAFEAYNDMAKRTGLPTARELTETRSKAILRILGKPDGSNLWDELISRVEKSEFLSGKNNRGFHATLDWILKPANFQKIMDGNYDNRGGQIRQPMSNADNVISVLDKLGGISDE